MSDNLDNPTLADVLDDLAASEPIIDAHTISRWIDRYPQYEQQLMDFAARWSLLTHLPADESPLADEAGYYKHGLEVVRKVITTHREGAAPAEESIASLLAEAARRNLNISQLAQAADLSVPIIAKLEQRLIAYSSIPREAVMNVATALQRSFESVTNYLQAPPSFAPGASYKAETTPEIPAQQEFSAAVSTDRTLSEEKKAKWLARATQQ